MQITIHKEAVSVNVAVSRKRFCSLLRATFFT